MALAEDLDRPRSLPRSRAPKRRSNGASAALMPAPELPAAKEFYARVKRETPTIIAELAK